MCENCVYKQVQTDLIMNIFNIRERMEIRILEDAKSFL